MWLLPAATGAQPVCSVTYYDEDAGMAQGHVTQMLQDKEGLMWFSTWNGLDRFDGVEFTNFKSRPGDGSTLPSHRIRDLRQMDNGELFCMAEKEWYHFDRTDGSFHPATAEQAAWLNHGTNGRRSTGTAHSRVEHRDRYNRLWTIDGEGRLFYEEKPSGAMKSSDSTATSKPVWHEYPLDKPLKDAQFFMSDHQHNLWLLMKTGVMKLSFSECPVSDFPQEKPTQVRCLFLDRDNRYWVCTRDDATVRLFSSDNRLLGYLTPQGTLSPSYVSFGSPVYCMMQSSDGTIWMGSKPNGLFALTSSGNAFTVKSLKGLLPCDDVYHIVEDSRHRLWLATMGGGVCCIEHPLTEKVRVWSSSSGFRHYPKTSENRVRFIHLTREGVLLAATTEGLLVGKIAVDNLADIEFRLHQREATRKESLSSNTTMDVLETSDHRIFVSTESGGVSELVSRDLLAAELQFRHYVKNSPLASDIALSLTENGQQLWITSSSQLMSLHANGEISDAFGRHFFHESRRFSEVHPLQLPDGRWIFGLMDGAFTLNDSILRKSNYVPTIAITAIDKQGAGVDYAVNHLKELVLQPSERSLTISFAALDYHNPEDVSYAFMMEGDAEWNYIGHNRTASFAGLTPGTYHLLLRSTNGDGVWVDNVRELTIVVTPTFWESWIGRMLIFLLTTALVGIALYTYYYIKRMKRRHHETLEAYLELVEQQTNMAELSRNSEDVAEEPAVHQPALSSEDETFMSRVMEYVSQHIGDPEANISDMAEAAATSRSGLNRKMKSLVGLTPADFLREARIKHACQILHTSELPVSEVAFRCGFTDPKYFGRCFKTSIGLSPTEYRSQPSDGKEIAKEG